MGGGGEKTEKPTSKRMSDERKKGNVFQSREIGILVSLLAAILTIQALGNIILQALMTNFHRFWDLAGSIDKLNPWDLRSIFVQGAGSYAVAAMPALLVAGLVSVLATVAQTRGNVSFEALKPKFGKMFNPVQAFKKFFNIRSIVELLKSLIKIVILGYAIYGVFIERMEELPRLIEMDFIAILFYGADFFMDIITTASAMFVVVAAFDYLYQRWQYEKDLRMTKQEVKEEYKQTEGDPQIKGQIRQKQRQMATSRMMAEVPSADVVVRNPNHYAVALRYEGGRNAAPRVVAKGADLLALRIVRVAEENGVMCVENKPLARSLYDNARLEAEIPLEFYGAVAEVLAFVYSVQGKSIDEVEPAS